MNVFGRIYFINSAVRRFHLPLPISRERYAAEKTAFILEQEKDADKWSGGILNVYWKGELCFVAATRILDWLGEQVI